MSLPRAPAVRPSGSLVARSLFPPLSLGGCQLLLVGSTALSCRPAWPREGAKIIALHRTVADAVEEPVSGLKPRWD